MSILFGVEQLRGLVIHLAMDELFGDDLPMADAHALARGVDSRSLRELAGLSKGQSRDAVDLFRELGSPVPDKSGARLHLMREAAASIVAGNGDPEDLARSIARKLLGDVTLGVVTLGYCACKIKGVHQGVLHTLVGHCAAYEYAGCAVSCTNTQESHNPSVADSSPAHLTIRNGP